MGEDRRPKETWRSKTSPLLPRGVILVPLSACSPLCTVRPISPALLLTQLYENQMRFIKKKTTSHVNVLSKVQLSLLQASSTRYFRATASRLTAVSNELGRQAPLLPTLPGSGWRSQPSEKPGGAQRGCPLLNSKEHPGAASWSSQRPASDRSLPGAPRLTQHPLLGSQGSGDGLCGQAAMTFSTTLLV